jgi:hypothetical protein
MTVYYRGRGVRITHRAMEVWRPAYQRFDLRDLCRVRVVARPATPPAAVIALRHTSSGVAGAVAVTAALIWTGGWPAAELPVPAAAIVALLVISVLVSGACWWIHPVEHELVAVYRGRAVELYRSPDARTFGQVRRALKRALEAAGDTGDGLAGTAHAA